MLVSIMNCLAQYYMASKSQRKNLTQVLYSRAYSGFQIVPGCFICFECRLLGSEVHGLIT